MRLTFGDMTKEVNVFNLEKQPRNLQDQTFEVNFIENICEKESEKESLFLDELFKDKSIVLMIRCMLEIIIL